MKKTKTLVLIIVIFTLIFMGVIFRLWYENKNNPKIDCSGRVVWEINNETFSGDLAYQMYNSQGIVTITGSLITAAGQRFKISRVVYFSYQKIHDNYIISSNRFVRFPSDELSDGTGHRSLPSAFLIENASFSFLIKRYREGWAFTTVGAPSLLCRPDE